MELRWTEMKYCDLDDLVRVLREEGLFPDGLDFLGDDFETFMAVSLEASNGSWHYMPDNDWYCLRKCSDKAKEVYARAKELVGDEMIYISW